MRYCGQKDKEPKKGTNLKNTMEQKRPLLSSEIPIHDFGGHLTLNGGRYPLPFTIPVPTEAAPSLEFSPCEGTLFECKYKVKVTVTERADTKAKNKGGLV